MESLAKVLKSAIVDKNWYAALFIALSVPDICGYLESPTTRTQRRYERWFEKYMLSKYTIEMGPNSTSTLHTFLSPSDCYALRCAFLHEGREEILEQRARNVLNRFHFIEPPPRGGDMIHRNQYNDVLQLQVDIFCEEILEGLRNWRQDVNTV